MKIPANTKKGYEIASEGDSINLTQISSKTRRGRVGGGVAQTLDTGMQQYTLKGARIRRLTPTECERLQGFPDGWTEGVSDSQRYKCLGNAVTVNVITAVISEMFLTAPPTKENDMIEQDLKRIADALEAIAAHVTQKENLIALPSQVLPTDDPAPKKKAPKTPPTPASEAKVVDLDSVTDALREVVQKKTPAKAKEILNKYGAAKLSELKPENYAAIYGDLKAAL